MAKKGKKPGVSHGQILRLKQRAWELAQAGFKRHEIAAMMDRSRKQIWLWLKDFEEHDAKQVLAAHTAQIENIQRQAFYWQLEVDRLRELVNDTPRPTQAMRRYSGMLGDGLDIAEIAEKAGQDVETVQRWIAAVENYTRLEEEYSHAMAECNTWWSRFESVLLIGWRGTVAKATRKGAEAEAPQFAFVFPDVGKFYAEIREFRRGNPPLHNNGDGRKLTPPEDGERTLTTQEWLEQNARDLTYPTEHL